MRKIVTADDDTTIASITVSASKYTASIAKYSIDNDISTSTTTYIGNESSTIIKSTVNVNNIMGKSTTNIDNSMSRSISGLGNINALNTDGMTKNG